MKKIVISVALLLGLATTSCNYLDIVPDERPTEADAFVDARAAEKYLYSCYSFLPDPRLGASSLDLMTADEVVLAGGMYNVMNSKYYLYNGQFNWTSSPSRFSAYEAFSRVWCLLPSGALNTTGLVSWRGARPVINLNANVKITSGSGTENDPYEISIG